MGQTVLKALNTQKWKEQSMCSWNLEIEPRELTPEPKYIVITLSYTHNTMQRARSTPVQENQSVRTALGNSWCGEGLLYKYHEMEMAPK